MRQHATITLAAASYTLRPPDGKRIKRFLVQPQDATVWLSPIPAPQFSAQCTSGTSFYVKFDRNAAGELPTGTNAIRQGLLVTAGSGVPAGAYVVSYANGCIELDQELSENIANETLFFDEPTPSAGTGLALKHTLAPTVFDADSLFPNGFTLSASTSTAITILWELA